LKKLVESLESQLHTKSVFDFYQISELEKEKLEKLSKSQLKQDIFAYLELGRKERGFFVEFGATNGVSLSNSYMLERDFGWNGILAEPAKIWHDQLKANRPNSIIETLCIWKDSGSKLTFNQTNDNELSTIDKYSDHDMHEKARKNGEKYDVVTISLLDLFKKHNAPQVIDYLSIDTEGSEFEILEAFFRDNDYYEIKIITCEHNFTPNREKIFELLKKYGYQRKYQVISAFDDFYVLQK
jgi:FkbM family methyltransferase